VVFVADLVHLVAPLVRPAGQRPLVGVPIDAEPGQPAGDEIMFSESEADHPRIRGRKVLHRVEREDGHVGIGGRQAAVELGASLVGAVEDDLQTVCPAQIDDLAPSPAVAASTSPKSSPLPARLRAAINSRLSCGLIGTIARCDREQLAAANAPTWALDWTLKLETVEPSAWGTRRQTHRLIIFGRRKFAA